MIYALCLLGGLIVIILVRTLTFRSCNTVTPVSISKPDLSDQVLHNLSEVIQCQTISYIDQEFCDEKELIRLHEVLEKAFPQVHKKLELDKINDYALLYTWKGSDPEKKPILLMAHQDVVPVEKGTEDDWTYPPFSGEIADGFIWGRGTLDIKSGLCGTLESIEYLLNKDFQPSRTIYLAYGFDEEISGKLGAEKIAEHLKQNNIELEFVLDEGGSVFRGMVPGLSKNVATNGIAEKGYASIELVAHSTGGHSSMPPRENAGAILAKAICRLESKPFPTRLEGASLRFLKEIGAAMTFRLKMIIANLWLFRPVMISILAASTAKNATIRTTAVVTMLEGSPSDNVMPQHAKAIVNVRILPGETIETSQKYLEDTIQDKRVTVQQSSLGSRSNPVPLSETDTLGYHAIVKSIYGTFEGVIAAPFLMVGTTDSRYYQIVTKNIYRFAPTLLTPEDLERIHSTDERISTEGYKDMIRFYIRLVEESCG